MHQRNITLLGHHMLLKTDGCTLICSRWLRDDNDDTEAACNVDMERKAPASAHDLENAFLDNAVMEIIEYLEGKRVAFDIEARPKGTDFQMKVWEELRRIPYGETISYAELARRIGKPKAYRAVANACGANPLPMFIPCHRVVASGGCPGGYTGGLDIKQSLLAIEKQNCTK